MGIGQAEATGGEGGESGGGQRRVMPRALASAPHQPGPMQLSWVGPRAMVQTGWAVRQKAGLMGQGWLVAQAECPF